MKYYTKYLFCTFFIIQTTSCSHEISAIVYTTQINPWLKATREAVEKFNQQHPDQKLEELKCKQLGYLSFTLKKIFYLNVTPHDSYRNYHAELAGPHLHKRHLSILPETHFKQIYYMLINHVVGKPK